MTAKFDLDAASDPVCGTLVQITSPFHADYGGKDIYFCSEACLNQFLKDPARFDGEGTIMFSRDMALARPQAHRVAAVPTDAAPSHSAGSGSRAAASPDAPPSFERAGPRTAAPADSVRPQHGEREGHVDAAGDLPIGMNRTLPDSAAAGGAPLGWLSTWYHEWSERRHVQRACRQMLARYHALVAETGDLPRRDHYRLVVMDRMQCGSKAADKMLAQASASFAEWPLLRELTLRDVVHYVSVAEYLVGRDRERGMRTDVGKLVAELIPGEL